MNNPLKIFHNLLFNSNALSPFAAISVDDEKLSLFDVDITERIIKETGKVFIVLDDVYWSGGKNENEYFLSKLLNITDKLIAVSCSQLENHIEQLVKNREVDYWLVVYNNMQCVYENLIAIRSRVLDYYCDGCVEQEDKAVHHKKYPFFFKEWATDLHEMCVANLGKRDTEFIVKTANQHFSIVVETAKMSPVIAGLLGDNPISHADHINVHDGKSSEKERKLIFVWSGTPKEFVQHLSPLVESKKLFINESPDRTPLVKVIYDIFQISTVEKGTKGKKVISLDSLQTYFKKEASGDIY